MREFTAPVVDETTPEFAGIIFSARARYRVTPCAHLARLIPFPAPVAELFRDAVIGMVDSATASIPRRRTPAREISRGKASKLRKIRKVYPYSFILHAPSKRQLNGSAPCVHLIAL